LSNIANLIKLELTWDILGVGGARDATLTFMVGCDDARFEAIKALLSHMGKNVVHCGGVGMGEAAKICNNMLMAISMIGVSETMNLGVRLVSSV
jgi:3-hydroxyisobutyrate dehydrogenase-like beta-hydroxyacid dehydrogenase